MIQINKQGNAIVIEFTDNDKYLFDGTIEIAPNELMVVIDESDMATFKRTSNGDVLFSQLIDQIQIAGSAVTKDTIIEQFAIIGFQSGGGGGTGAVSSVNGQTGDVVLTAGSLNAYTKQEVNSLVTAETVEREKKDSDLGAMIAAETAAREQAISQKQDTLVSGQNIKTINNQSLLGEGNIQIEGGGSSITLQEGGKGTGTNYIYSNTEEAKNNRAVITKIFMDRKLDSEDNITLYVNYWGTDGSTSYSNTNMHIPSATTEKAGLLSASDKQKLDSLNNVVDTSMSDTSTNPVQNKVIKTYVDGLIGDINTILDSINGEVI